MNKKPILRSEFIKIFYKDLLNEWNRGEDYPFLYEAISYMQEEKKLHSFTKTLLRNSLRKMTVENINNLLEEHEHRMYTGSDFHYYKNMDILDDNDKAAKILYGKTKK